MSPPTSHPPSPPYRSFAPPTSYPSSPAYRRIARPTSHTPYAPSRSSARASRPPPSAGPPISALMMQTWRHTSDAANRTVECVGSLEKFFVEDYGVGQQGYEDFDSLSQEFLLIETVCVKEICTVRLNLLDSEYHSISELLLERGYVAGGGDFRCFFLGGAFYGEAFEQGRHGLHSFFLNLKVCLLPD
ncbi:uncharacterized protein [Triticum aestivum]|uniref:uncharacterized protein n=1 Tax=Triticum aestivum TaxID=4565 RepID=UPI001D00E7E1|nr:uncharacterized protein LOC123075980 [Triticum aestivum]